MRSPLLQKMRQEFDYGNIDFLRGFVQRSTIKENKNSLMVIIMGISRIQLDFVLSYFSGI